MPRWRAQELEIVRLKAQLETLQRQAAAAAATATATAAGATATAPVGDAREEHEEAASPAELLLEAIGEQATKVRGLKSSNAAAEVVHEELQNLLALKAEYKTLTGEDRSGVVPCLGAVRRSHQPVVAPHRRGSPRRQCGQQRAQEIGQRQSRRTALPAQEPQGTRWPASPASRAPRSPPLPLRPLWLVRRGSS